MEGGYLHVPYFITNGPIALIPFDLTIFDCWLNRIQKTAKKKGKYLLKTSKNKQAADLRKSTTFDPTILRIYLLGTNLAVSLLQYTYQL